MMEQQMKAYWAMPRNRVMGASVLIGVMLGVAVWMIPGEEDGTRETGAAQIPALKESRQGTLFLQDVASVPAMVRRDPFKPAEVPVEHAAAPPADAPPKMTLAAAHQGAGTVLHRADISAAAPLERLRLAGVVACGSRGMALLEYRSESKVCAAGEAIGPYRVLRVFEEQVLMHGPKGNFTVRIGR